MLRREADRAMSFWGWIIFGWFTAGVALILARCFGLTSLSWWLCAAPLALLVLAVVAAVAVFGESSGGRD